MSNQRWYDLAEPEGRGWHGPDTKRLTDRLPARAEGTVPDVVWGLSRHSSGLYYRFRTDAAEISARWTLPDGPIAKPHMPAASVSGLDLYADDDHGRPRWAGWAAPETGGTAEAVLQTGIRAVAEPREYRLYLPLFNEVDDVAIGVPDGASFEVCPADPTPPVVYYGTSIVHGAAASRPGMAMPAQLGRRLERPVIGLGFSGNGRMEVELAALLAEIDAAGYLIDCLPNMSPEQVAERTVPFVRRLRRDRPDTPILLIEDRTLTSAWLVDGMLAKHRDRRAAYREAYRTLAEADAHLYHLPYDALLGTDDEATVDGSHPTDLGFTRMTDLLTPLVRRLL
ncbi:SGNH/GDSL hydrolase family protein [Microlunatus soli]|uniref:Lysophospholipase L1 n=1 Tax=Microlunatus soli TaxID=630515 RepID=A0A1H1X0T0_9ACTN|nr:SGNH/GDSL hydrolase family protein [Microlunatus soli]SDT02965.1 Lysophospholipase L1 [Microlunatus soli]